MDDPSQAEPHLTKLNTSTLGVSRAGVVSESITQPLFKSKEAREFLELVEGFHKLYKNDASIAKNLVQGTASQLSTSIATSAEGAIKQKVVKGAFDPIFRLLPDKILFGLFAKQIQGGALRYHLKKALSRSLNYDDFKIKLEKELKRTNFNSNTSRLIDEFMQNLDTFNAEKEAKLAKIREEQARIKEEEAKRAEEIYKRQEEIYQAQEANNLKDILEAEEKPLKDEFGVNFEGFKGKEAIEKLLEEQRGQVRGAFYKEGLGEIDLVWGDENFGLRHILEQRTKQWGEEKALKFISHLNENIEKGQIVEVQKGRAAIKTDLTTIILDKKENNFVLTAFRDRNNKKELESLNLSQSKTFTSENAEANAKESPVTSLNQESIIAQKAKNDEVLEAEVIEEVGLNEPMKFLEFQQRKLLTYIKENTPLKLLEHKKELKTRDILNFLEQSALNGKQKVFLMRNLERDFTKLKEDFKELESQSFKRDLLDKTKPLRKAEKEELTSEVLEQVQKENLKLYLNDTSGNLTKFLNAKKPFKITMRGANIKHILNRHGENSTLAKNGQPFVNLEDIKKYDEIINNADRQILKENDKGEKTLLSGKQINGHYIVISSVRLKNGELKLKTMYKENGKLENDKAFKSVKLPSETPSVLRGQSLTTDLDGYPSHADESIAQNAKSESEKEVLERQIPFIEAEIQKYEAKIASLDERIKKTQTRIQPYLDEINALQKQYDELYFTETRGEEANAKKWLKLEEIKAKQEELRKPYNDALFKFVFPHQRLKGKVQTEIQKLKFGLQDRALRLEEIQNEALNTSKAQKAWLEAFNLKSLDEAYIPNFKAEVKEAINRVLGGEEIKLTKGSFEKLLKRDREEFLPYIKDTLEKANAVIKQVDGALIFAKDYRNERLGKFFASVSRNDEGEWIITSNAPKNLNNLKNKLNEGGELLYSDLPELTIIAKPDLDANALNSEANLKDIIPQKANLEAVNKQKDKEFLEAYEKADFKGKVELAKQDINEEIKFLEKQKEEFERITQQKDYNDIELEQARKILENAKEEVEGHYRIKYMQNGKEMRAYISKTDYFNEGKILSKDEILHKIIQKTIYKDKIENIKKTSDKLKKQIKIIDEYLKEYGDNEAGAISDDIIEKFKYYDFAKNAGKGAVIIGERQKGLYEQAQKVLNSRLLKAKKRATQSKKNYNITYDEARKLFYKGDMSEEQKELFQSVLPIAQKLNVRIRTAIREPYEDMIKDTTNIAGMYRYELNTATLKKGGNYTDTQRAETLLHELIHSVTSRAMSLHKTPLRDKMLSKTQIKAIDEIDQIYKKLYKFKKTFKLQDENGADLYGIKNSHEMLAELANPMFSSKLKEIGLYEKLVNNIMKIILSVRDFIRLRSDKNVYEKLKQCLKDIIENYKDDFTQEYEKQNIRDFTLTSQTQKEQIYTQRQEIKNTLKAKINQAIANENTGEKAILTNKGISKMLSDKAISKSVDNGFSREEHLRAVGVVDELFKRAKRAFSKRDEKDKNLSIYRYNAPFKNANALMTLKEYKQNGKRIYSLELENLEAAKFNPSGKDLAEQLSKSKDADTTTFHTPIDNPDESIAQKSDNIYHSNPHLGAGLVGGVLNGVEQDENGNLSFDPVKFAMGFLGGAAGSKAVKESIKWRANKVKKAYPNIAKNNPALMEQIAKRDLLTYAKNETQNALTRLLNKNKLFDSTKGLFAGEKALLSEAYAPHKARLEKAKELEGSGADEIEIWEKTGWYKDKDNKWKFEISQRGGELDLAKIKDKDSEAKLGEILKDDELFKAYPQLRDMSVKHVDLSGNYGFYYVPYNDIKLVRPHIQLDIDEIKTSPYKVKEVLYHEIQHAIQHKEQFAYGLSYMAETYERYLKQHGEVEARNIQERMKNPTKIHPHKTMDTDIEDTIAES
ncbi:LPD23 domain-containing protein, partial [Campylobacter upsaliensis]